MYFPGAAFDVVAEEPLATNDGPRERATYPRESNSFPACVFSGRRAERSSLFSLDVRAVFEDGAPANPEGDARKEIMPTEEQEPG